MALSIDIQQKYNDIISKLLIARYHTIGPLGILLSLVFNVILDRIIYPELAGQFLLIRLACCFFVAAGVVATMTAWGKKRAFMIMNVTCASFSVGFALMAYMTNGTSSAYFSGVNLVLIGVCAVNTFKHKQNAWNCTAQILIYNIFALISPAPFNIHNFILGNFFMASTAILSVLVSVFSSEQHYDAFIKTEKLASIAKSDPLTGILNRAAFLSILESKLALTSQDRSAFYLVLFDIDYFKTINDTCGHSEGDQVITSVVDLARRNFRPNDCIGRYGGDEFLILFNSSEREPLVARLQDFLSQVNGIAVSGMPEDFRLSVSAGVARYEIGDLVTAKHLLEEADRQLYRSKKDGRNRFSGSCLA